MFIFAKARSLDGLQLGSLACACIFLAGCAVQPKPTSTPPHQTAVLVSKDPSLQNLEAIRSGLKTHEDSLVLDLLIGYRELRLAANPDIASLATVQIGRMAYDQLESKLRQGGMNSKSENNERVYSVGNRDNLSLLEVLTAANKSAQKLVLDGDLEKAKQRNKDIVLNRPTLAFAVEDAQWSLALIDAVKEPGIPESTKKKLLSLHEAYLQDAPQDEVVRLVNGLLPEVADEKLRQQLKKLANRAWERDRRANRLPQGAKQAAIQDTTPAPAKAVQPSNQATTTAPDPAKPIAVLAQPSVHSDSTPKPENASAKDGSESPIDSLIGAGKYVDALHALDALDAKAHADFIRDRRSKAGERFCDERRKSAAESYKKSRTAANSGVKEKLLQMTASDLDSCLFYFPETSVAAKVHRNREMVETELKKLKK